MNFCGGSPLIARALLTLIGALLVAGGAPAAPASGADPVAAARAVLVEYDAAVKRHKVARGHNVTLQLEDPVPEVLAAWRGVPLPTATGWLRELLAREPGHKAARPLLAQLEGRQARHQAAAEVLEEHVRRHPADAPGWNVLGVACARLEGTRDSRVARAAAARKLACYRRATGLDPADATAWANLGNALAAAGLPAEAVQAGLKAVGLRNHFVYAWMNLGLAYGLQGDARREKDAYRHAIEVPASAENCPFARFNLGLCHEQDRDFAQAERWYRDALRVGLPQGPRSRHAALFHHNLARALYHRGNYAESAREATEALKIDSRLPEPHSLLGHLFEKAGQPAQARRLYLIATRLLARYGESQPDAPLRHTE